MLIPKDASFSKQSKIYIAGHTGLVGSAVLRCLQRLGYYHLITRSSKELDLTRQRDVYDFFEKEKPDMVFLCAAKVGGILANAIYPALFIQQNLMIQSNVFEASKLQGVSRLIFLGSSCIYPRECLQPIKEEYLLSGPLEQTNRSYAVAKIAGIEACWAYNKQYGTRFLSVMPTNLYGPGDNYDLLQSHVLPAILRKMHEAKMENRRIITLWGTGKPRREFLYSDDLAEALVFLMALPTPRFDSILNNSHQPPIINIGCGYDLAIEELAKAIAECVGYKGGIEWDISKPDGTPQKLLDVSKLTMLGWSAKTLLHEGIQYTYSQAIPHFKL